ncbi:MAG: hypothetical protein EXX96DRAFT_348990 [Benjaminiella poitrasii]|nr:MAG: hypothetical protein EXX96DRAFT_348990 [Benjaminiella poitrasii]
MRKASQKKKDNTLFSYFMKVKDPAKSESLSSLISRTTPSSLHSEKRSTKTSVTTTPLSKDLRQSNITTKTVQAIDLTNDDDDDDLIVIPSQESATLFLSSQTSTFSNISNSSSSQTSAGKIYTEEMKNTSKYNRKGWSPREKERGPQKSSQDSRLSQEQIPARKFDRIMLQKPRITAKPCYDWLGPNDVKPYSSNYRPYSSQSQLEDKPPSIIPQTFDRSHSNYTTEYAAKRNWDSSFGSASSKPYWDENSSFSVPNKKAKGSTNNFWTKINSNTRPARSSPTMASLTTSIASQNEYLPDLSAEQQRVLDMVVNEHKMD